MPSALNASHIRFSRLRILVSIPVHITPSVRSSETSIPVTGNRELSTENYEFVIDIEPLPIWLQCLVLSQ